MRVPFFDPTRQAAALKDELMRAIAETLAEGRYILGPRVALL